MRKFLIRSFSADLRSLAVLRVSLASILLCDLFSRALYLRTYYTDFGLLPRGFIIDRTSSAFFSLHFFSGSIISQVLLFTLNGLVLGALLLGYRTRTATILSWFFLTSLQARNPLVNHGGDALIRCLMFWAMFLPLGERLSIDQKRKGNTHLSENSVCSIGTISFFLQLACLYWFTFALKSGKDWITDGSAVRYALQADQFATPLGQFFLNYPVFLKYLTYWVAGVELFGPFLLLSPVYVPYARIVGILLFFNLHFGLFLCMELGVFPFVSSFSTLAFLPPEFWEWANKRWGKKFRKLHHAVSYFSESKCRTLRSSLSKETVKRTWSLSTTVIGVFLLTYMLFWNLWAFYGWKPALPSEVTWLGRALRIDQHWDMFAPTPLKDDGWFVMPGKLRNGNEVDIFKSVPDFDTQYPLSWDKPYSVNETYPDSRWRRYMMNLWRGNFNEHLLLFGKHVCREWNNNHNKPEELLTFELIFMLELSLPDGKETPPQKRVLWRHDCWAKEKS